jgi:multidrug efflux pump subunit AcrA (membrane-fusion protein)
MNRITNRLFFGTLVLGILTTATSGGPSNEGSQSFTSGQAEQSKPESPLAKSLKLRQCLVSVIDDIEVPAREAGMLAEMRVQAGATVKAKDVVALIDDERSRLQERVAASQHEQAKAQAENDVDVRYSKAAAEVSHAEHQEALAANNISSGAVAPTEVRRLFLTSRRSDLAIEQAADEQKVAGLAEKVRFSELQLAEHDTRRRRLFVPVAGVVVEIHKQPGEWLQAGETVMRVVRMDHLRVEGFVNAAHFGDEEIVDCSVQVTVPRQRGQKETFAGKIVFVNPVIEASGNYRIWAEVENRQQSGRWLLRPGMEAEMTLELKEPVQTALLRTTSSPSPRNQ